MLCLYIVSARDSVQHVLHGSQIELRFRAQGAPSAHWIKPVTEAEAKQKPNMNTAHDVENSQMQKRAQFSNSSSKLKQGFNIELATVRIDSHHFFKI